MLQRLRIELAKADGDEWALILYDLTKFFNQVINK